MIRYTAQLRTIRVVNSSATVPIQLSTTQLLFTKAIIYGQKSPQTNNTGTVYIGTSSTNGDPFIPITAGGTLTIEAPASQMYDFANLWMDVATAADGVMIMFS